MSDRTSPNVHYIGDRVRVSGSARGSGGMHGVIKGFDGPQVLVLLDGFAAPVRVPYTSLR